MKNINFILFVLLSLFLLFGVNAATVSHPASEITPGTFPAGDFIFQGNVGIGTTSPAAKLDVAGNVRIADGSQGAGKVLTSDANGVVSWLTPSSTSASWSSITGKPAGFADDTDNVGITSESDPTVTASVKDGVSWSEISSRPSGLDDGDQVGITSISSGSGITLSPDPTTSTGTVSVNTNSIQSRVTGTCPSGYAIRVINSDGSVTCERSQSVVCVWNSKTYTSGATCADVPTFSGTCGSTSGVWYNVHKCNPDGTWYIMGSPYCSSLRTCGQ